MKKVCVYLKNKDLSPSGYYRLTQFFSKMDDINFVYRSLMSNKIYTRVMPLSKKNIFVKVFFYLVFNVKYFFFLVKDLFFLPDVIVINRSLIPRHTTLLHKKLLSSIKKHGARIVWSLDDNILESHEVTENDFNFTAGLADRIIVSQQFLKSLLPLDVMEKTEIHPTTDGDIYCCRNEEILLKRAESFKDKIVIVWCGTSGNLKYVENIMDGLEAFSLQSSKEVVLKIICDRPLDTDSKKITVQNIKWSRETAVQEILSSHVGIMPLVDNMFTRGKAGFKLVQYMAAGIPVVGSSVGYNKEIIKESFGVLVSENNGKNEWKEALEFLTVNSENYEEFSRNAFTEWKKSFDFEKEKDAWKFIINN